MISIFSNRYRLRYHDGMLPPKHLLHSYTRMDISLFLQFIYDQITME